MVIFHHKGQQVHSAAAAADRRLLFAESRDARAQPLVLPNADVRSLFGLQEAYLIIDEGKQNVGSTPCTLPQRKSVVPGYIVWLQDARIIERPSPAR